jgi:hypothetical protein
MMNHWVHDYVQMNGRYPNRVIRNRRLVRYRGRPPWLAAYWQWLYSGGAR